MWVVCSSIGWKKSVYLSNKTSQEKDGKDKKTVGAGQMYGAIKKCIAHVVKNSSTCAVIVAIGLPWDTDPSSV